MARESAPPCVVARACVFPGLCDLHNRAVADDEYVVEVDRVNDLTCVGGDVPVLYQDPYEKWNTMREAWDGSNGGKFLTAWKKEMVQIGDLAASGGGTEGGIRLRKKRTIPTMFGAAACNKENTSILSNHPMLDQACAAFVSTLQGSSGSGGDNPASNLPIQLQGEGGKEVIKHLIDVGGPLLACVQAAFPQLGEGRRSAKRSADDVWENSGAKKGRTSGLLKATGETTSEAKLLNSPNRMGVVRAYAANTANSDAAQTNHSHDRNEKLLKVNSHMKEAGLFSTRDVMEGRTPTIADLKEYIRAGKDDRIVAFRKYKNVHELQGKHVAYQYLFDFVYGGGEKHPTLEGGETLPPVIKDKSEVAKAPKKAIVPQLPVVSEVACL